MKFLKKYTKFIKEANAAPAPVKEPNVIPAPVKPTRPNPRRIDRTIKEPKIKPEPKAEDELLQTAEGVAYTFIAEMSKAGKSVKNLLK